MALRQRQPLEGEVKREVDVEDAPRKQNAIRNQDIMRHAAELVRLLEAGDAVEEAPRMALTTDSREIK